MPRIDRPRLLLAMLAGIPILAGCTLIATFDGRRGRDGTSSDCPWVHGPQSVRVGDFCIDSTEVTRGQYSEFLADYGETPKDPSAACAFNTSLVPEQTLWSGGTGPPEFPVRGVEACDAREFCAWSGKRLCGRRAPGGGPVTVDNRSSVAVDEWYYACSHAGERAFPYGSVYDPQACTTLDNPPDGSVTREVGTLPGCEGGFPGIFDMSGNTWEWEDSCMEASPSECVARGGSYLQTGTAVGCDGFYIDTTGDTGIRCCSD